MLYYLATKLYQKALPNCYIKTKCTATYLKHFITRVFQNKLPTQGGQLRHEIYHREPYP